jgi:hypothetical protein
MSGWDCYCVHIIALFELHPKSINDLKKTRLSRCRMIWRLPHPLPPRKKGSLFLILPVCRWLNFLRGKGGEELGEEPNHTTARKPGPL